MPLEIERSDQAEQDLLEIWHFITDHDERAADRLLRRILELLVMLAQRPDAGRARLDLGPAVRSFPATQNFGIFYSRTDTTLRLLRVMRFSRDITPDLFTD